LLPATSPPDRQDARLAPLAPHPKPIGRELTAGLVHIRTLSPH
jgi:hypothetical protein